MSKHVKNIRKQAVNDQTTSFDELNSRHIVSLYKIILADRWRDIDKSERKALIKVLLKKQYSKPNIPELMKLVDEAKNTSIFQMYMDDDLFTEQDNRNL